MASSNFSQDTKNKVTELKAKSASAIDEAKGKVQELASSAAQTVQGVASDVALKAQDWAGNMANRAQETATAAVDRTNEGIAAVGHRMTSMSGSIREAAPKNGAIGSAAAAVADKLQAGGGYLEENGLADMGKDLTDVVRNYPVQSVLVGFGVGCLLGLALRWR
jgi:ElaB/YqjD/DUF883 family membrane-anchored ribosome-binding protein